MNRHLDHALPAIIVALLLTACARRDSVSLDTPDASVPAYSPARVRAHVDALAHDSMLGRLTAGPGIEIAARYIDDQFARMELRGLLGGPRVLRYEFAGGTLAPNVVAAIPGNVPGRADSMIVIVAHFDHIGIGSRIAGGDSIFNGADDNASGTAALLEAARLLKMRGGLPYTLVFAAVSGEESGLVGSRILLASGRLDASRVVAAINMDMVGRGPPSRLTIVAGPRSSLGHLALRVARETPQLGLSPNLEFLRPNARARSDHGSFLELGAPAIHLFTGFHADYHRASDSADRVDADKAARIAAFAARMAERIATRTSN